MTSHDEIERRLGYRFRDPDLLTLALVHSTARDPHGDNRRLAFLGDAVLGLAAAEFAFRSDRHAEKGRLTDVRKRLVPDHELVKVAEFLGIHEGGTIRKGGAAQPNGRTTMLAEAVEALVGAVYEDAERSHAIDVARRLLERVFGSRAFI